MRNIMILVCLSFSIRLIGKSVEVEEVHIRKNSIYTVVGTYFSTYGVSGNYEHVFIPVKEKIKTALKCKLGYGYFEGLGYSSVFSEEVDPKSLFVKGHIGFITRPAQIHHFELEGGVTYFFDGSFNNSEPISFGLGYRYQKPKGNLLFRLGISFPEGFYVGGGFAF